MRRILGPIALFAALTAAIVGLGAIETLLHPATAAIMAPGVSVVDASTPKGAVKTRRLRALVRAHERAALIARLRARKHAKPAAKPRWMSYTHARHLSTARVRAIIRAEARRAGYGHADTAALVTLAKRESSWHPWSKSHGGGYLGLFQLSRGKCRGKPWFDPRWNTRRAIVYIRARYHTPRRALAHSLARGWY
jgi:hypothetical protein